MKKSIVLLVFGFLFCWVTIAAAGSVTVTDRWNYVNAIHDMGYQIDTATNSGAGDVDAETLLLSNELAGAYASVSGNVLSVGQWYFDASPCTLEAYASERLTFTASASQLLVDVAIMGSGSMLSYNRDVAWGMELLQNGNTVAIGSTDVVVLLPGVDDIWNGTATLTTGLEYSILLWAKVAGFTDSSIQTEQYSLELMMEYPESPQQPIPEPATMLLLSLGLMGLAGVRRKIQK